jgi:hypothetical protein
MFEILRSFRRTFTSGNLPKDAELTAPPTSGLQLRLQSESFIPTQSSPEGGFTFYAGDKAISAMEELAGISLKEMQALPGRVLSKCRELGFAHNEPAHFFFDAQEIAHPHWRVAKIVPPMDMGQGTFADRTIHAFLPTIREEIQSTKNELVAAAAMLRANNLFAKEAEYLAAAPKLIKAKYKMHLTHEMVHIFATDEHRDIMQVLGLDLLELLTDSINLVTFYPDYRKAGAFEKAGVAEGIGYLLNLIRAEQPGRNLGPEIVDLAFERAKTIIDQCRKKYIAARP